MRFLSVICVLVSVAVCFALVPNDPCYDEQWPLPRYGMEDIWEMPLIDSTVLVAFVGTGLYVQHPDLQGNIWINPSEDIDGDGIPGDVDDLDGVDNDSNGLIDDLNGWNFFDQNNDLEDFYGFGAAQVGAIGAVGNNGIGIAGMLWYCEILTAKTTYIDNDGFEVFSIDAIIEGIQYAMLQGARVIFLGYYHTALNAAERGVLEWVIGNGVVVVAVTHGADRPYYPAAYNDVIGVAMIDSTDQLEVYGPSEDNDLCVYWHNFPVLSPTGIVGYMQSTLVAGAHVAGAAAYLLALHPEWTGEQVTQELYRLAVDISDANLGLEEYTGHGRLSLTGISEAERPYIEVPSDISLQIFPNPFNAQTKITFLVNHSGPATVDVYNVLGMRVATLTSIGSPGERQVIFDGGSLGSGVYFARFSNRRESGVARMILLK